LVAKADAEIHDLEDELAILQCQLKWAESDIHKDPCELFCAVFKGKIDSLTSATERLRNDNGLSGHHMDVRLELQRPAERICDIIYGLIRPEFLELDKEVRVLVSFVIFLVSCSFKCMVYRICADYAYLVMLKDLSQQLKVKYDMN